MSFTVRGARWCALGTALVLWASAASPQEAPWPPQARPDFAPQVSREEAIVVSISTRRTVRGARDERSGFVLNDPRVAAPSASAAARAPQLERELASGFIIGADGFILTNAHVVVGIDEAVVRLADGRQFEARVIGLDQPSDVALLKIAATGLPVATIGRSDQLQVGEWVAAIGAPFGLEGSVTAGIVSARQRYLPGAASGVPLIQTDVAINPGSSGGPLFNLRGEVVGMNAMVVSSSGGYMGVSVAVPIDIAMRVADALRSVGHVVRGQLGVSVQELTPDLARSFGLRQSSGALVTRVARGGPAERAGLRSGDVLLGIDPRTDTGYTELQQQVAAAPPGSRLLLNVWSGGQVRAVSVGVVETPGDALNGAPDAPPVRDERLGLVLGDPGAALRRALNVESGLVVRDVRGAAFRAGIQIDDVVVAIGDRPVGDLVTFDTVLAAVPADQPVALLVARRGGFGFIAVMPPH